VNVGRKDMLWNSCSGYQIASSGYRLAGLLPLAKMVHLPGCRKHDIRLLHNRHKWWLTYMKSVAVWLHPWYVASFFKIRGKITRFNNRFLYQLSMVGNKLYHYMLIVCMLCSHRLLTSDWWSQCRTWSSAEESTSISLLYQTCFQLMWNPTNLTCSEMVGIWTHNVYHKSDFVTITLPCQTHVTRNINFPQLWTWL